MVGIAPEDDDGQSLTQDAPKHAKIDAKQAVQLNDLATELGADKSKFCAYLGVKSFEEINASQFEIALAALERKRKKEETS